MASSSLSEAFRIPYKLFRGFKIPERANDDFFEFATSYKPRPEDVFIASYPKCGTTWAQHIVYLIFSRGKPASDNSHVHLAIPFLEQDGYPNNNGLRPLAVKYHLPFYLTPHVREAKYIFVTRNPLDTCVSYYHFLKCLPGYAINNFDEFFEAFVEGELPYGDYFDHLLSWYEHKEESNLLFLTFESMKQDHQGAVKRIATFLGKEDIVNDKDVFKRIVEHSSFEAMKARVDDSGFMETYLRLTTIGENSELLDFLQKKPVSPRKESKKQKPVMLRKGSVGDWRNHFSKDQERRMKEKFLQKTAGTDLRTLWKDIFRDH